MTEHSDKSPSDTVLRFHSAEDYVDKHETDRVWFDRKTGKEIRRYDLGDPADYQSSHGGASDSEWFLEKDLNMRERIPAAEAHPIPQYTPEPDHFDDEYYDDYDYSEDLDADSDNGETAD